MTSLKKITVCSLLFLLLFTCSVQAAPTPQDLHFAPIGGGKYIYENNIEALRRADLSDDSNPSPTYLMNNADLEPGKYSVFISHNNHTGRYTASGEIQELGFDIEVDMQFLAKEQAQIRVSSVAFEIPFLKTEYINGNLTKYENAWVFLSAWSTYLKTPIYQVRSDKKYFPLPFEPVTLNLAPGEIYWVSNLISNYAPVPYLKGVHMLVDFEILSGSADANIAALKHTGTLRDRSRHVQDAARGTYVRDWQYKGVADTLPGMEASLSYAIDDHTASGEFLPVTVYNQYQPEGNTVSRWMTNINPQADSWSRKSCAESDMLHLRFYDPSKLQYYGAAVPQDQRDPYWLFDTLHSDTDRYFSAAPALNAASYQPNYLLSTDVNNIGYACNLGNYGVSLYYHISIENKGTRTRYANYNLMTTADNIVILRDAAGVPMQNYALCRGPSDEKIDKTMASVPLPAGKTTSFILQVILPTNERGGMENSLFISDRQADMGYTSRSAYTARQSYRYTGKRYLKWEGQKLYASTDLAAWQEQPVGEEARALFDGNWDNFEILENGGGYVVKWDAYDSQPANYRAALGRHSTVYFFDRGFRLTAQKKFPDYPRYMAFAKNRYFVRAGSVSVSDDTVNWSEFPFASLPTWNNGKFCALVQDGAAYLSTDGANFSKVSYMGKQPSFFGALDGVYYYTDGTRLGLSADGLYWTVQDMGEKIETVDKVGDALLVNKTLLPLPDAADKIWVRLNGEILGFDVAPVTENDRTLVPMRFLLEKLGGTVSWDEESRIAGVSRGQDQIYFAIDDNTAWVNGEAVPLDVPARQISSRTMIPLRFLSETLGYQVTWDQPLKLVEIKAGTRPAL